MDLGSRLYERHEREREREREKRGERERDRFQYRKVNICLMTVGELWKYCLPRDT
jgi:hypothetical protein